jgi:phosphatidylserine/phosphatidylglycerophosphate/cardiolipin synthase-like enzyme
MSWHDAHIELDKEAAKDVSNNFIERWNLHRLDFINEELNETIREKIKLKFPILKVNTYKIYKNISEKLPKVKNNNVKLSNDEINDDYSTCESQNLR